MEHSELKELLDHKYFQYNNSEFIESDPIQIPHSFSTKQDIEIAAFLSATIAWGQRKTIIKNAFYLLKLMDNKPYDFICNATESDLEIFSNFKHRTFNGDDCKFFIRSLQNIYKNHGGLENVFTSAYQQNESIESALVHFRNVFLEPNHLYRSEKHIANIQKNSAAKRLNMFLMWMVRNDNRGVHFGLWKNISTKDIFLPLDVHTSNIGRKLGLLNRKQNDWKAVFEITSALKKLDPDDPIKYDFALFGLGIFDKF